MTRIQAFLAISAAAVIAHSSANASETGTFRLRAEVPVVCKLTFQAPESASAELGTLVQYCNSPTGFALKVSYQPGSLKGARLSIGSKSIMLDGSGQAEIYRANGPKIERGSVLVDRPAGSIASALKFEIVPA